MAAATATQAQRLIGVTTPLGADTLLLVALHGQEGLSTLFRFTLECLADNKKEVAFDKLLGQPLTARVTLADGKKQRYFTGLCSRVGQGGSDVQFTTYYLELVPQVWLLTRRTQSRIFQHVTVPDILKKVFDGFDVEWKIEGTFPQRDYCVQYRETDFAFASRLMEEEGIYYYFKHGNGTHRLCVANTPAGHADNPEVTTATYETPQEGKKDDDRVTRWVKRQELRAGKVTLWDHHFELPHKHLEADKTLQESVAIGKANHKLLVGPASKLELYDYPGGYAQRFDGIDKGGGERPADVQKVFTENKRAAEIRIQEEAAAGVVIDGTSSCRHLTAGYKFTLATVPSDKVGQLLKAEGPYVLTSVSHHAEQPAFSTGSSGGFEYYNQLTCIPAALPFRPARLTVKPVIPGTQTAVVVGPKGEEIFTDKYGRIKVQFHWDRQGKNDADSSCWLRVATIWAGKQWGVIHIPRIGHEVIVGFEEGDPDRPIVLGSVYNADHMPPGKLPGDKVKSGLRSATTPGSAGFNGMVCDDTKQKEMVTVHAQKDMSTTVEHDDTQTVHHNRAITVDGTHTETIKGDTKITIAGGGKETPGKFEFTVAQQTATVQIQKDTKITIVEGPLDLNVQANKATVHVKGLVDEKYDDTQTTTVQKKITLESATDEIYITAATKITLHTGDSLLVMEKDGTIKISAKNITISGGETTKIGVGNQNVTCDKTKVATSGAAINSSAVGMHEITGAVVKIN